VGAISVKMKMMQFCSLAIDVSNLHQLLDILHFDKDTGLCTNFTKSEIFRIRCDGIDIPQVLGEFQAKTGAFP
jgi:hypothetical protein